MTYQKLYHRKTRMNRDVREALEAFGAIAVTLLVIAVAGAAVRAWF